MTFRIGIISDTHGLLRPEAERALADVDHIIHGGDIGDPNMIAALRRIAPVTAIRDNVDKARWADAYAKLKPYSSPGAQSSSCPIVRRWRSIPPLMASTSSSPAIPTCRRSTRSAACCT